MTCEQWTLVEQLRDKFRQEAEQHEINLGWGLLGAGEKLDAARSIINALTALLASPAPARDYLACQRCGGPHRYDTSVPSPIWNRVIRAKGLSEFLCLSCIVEIFAKDGENLTAELWGQEFNGFAIDVRVNQSASAVGTLLVTREQLASIEWGDDNNAYCRVCKNWRVEGHHPDCWLARALTAAPEPSSDIEERVGGTLRDLHSCEKHADQLPDKATASTAPEPSALVALAQEFVTWANTIWKDNRDGRRAKKQAEQRMEVLARQIMDWPLSSSVAPEPPIRPLDSGQGGQGVQRVAPCQTKNADRRDGCSEPPALVALVLEYQEAQHAVDALPDESTSADVFKTAYERVAAAQASVLAWTPAAPAPSHAPADIHRVREVAAAFREGYRLGHADGEAGEESDAEPHWDRSNASAQLPTWQAVAPRSPETETP